MRRPDSESICQAGYFPKTYWQLALYLLIHGKHLETLPWVGGGQQPFPGNTNTVVC